MNPLQSEENGEGSSVSLRDNDQTQIFFESNLTRTEPSFISSPYEPEMNEIFDMDSSDEKDEELA
ncbi:31527_t:CDS:1, partial [Racocetra persica]